MPTVPPAAAAGTPQPKTGTLRTGQVGEPLNLDPPFFTPPSGDTIVLASDLPRPGLFDFFQYLTIVDRNALEAPHAASKLNGTGPFAFVEWAQGNHMALTRNKS